ncbi:acyl-CoA dehydrogenase family protein [Thiococcus pfennigii]|uniref:acyl-CoA dehydrogenase family protein n=1 Tax=Thiococcus pfennigii TaxID=1057 RepID=UPI0019054784|nr:acyl-CoA dehydrogenase family protein [Thiococcus pfennigii]MBK1699874.1 acyl-CoA dehydrogenase [Thiococcus pfennigii]MBK1732526.1 acyl-CoA dehydrogenase [Thiococcus pfennigii]
MANYFTDNADLLFQFDRLQLEDVVDIAEHGYTEAAQYDFAPTDYQDALDNYRKVLEIVGDIAANTVAPQAAAIDEEGSHFADGQVTYAKGIQEAIKRFTEAELMGFTLPRRYGGLNLPTTIYTMAIEMVSRAEASLMNLFGLQDISETINKYGTEEQRAEFLPQFASGEATGAMALTEPDAGSDLQAVNMLAYQDEEGQWRLKGVKRFITNGNAQILLVLARSEPGTKDGRGLSMFACYGRDGVKVRRIENKLGIHGSPTCELQFNDTPAQLIGKRKFGLIKYVMDMMNGARLAVAAQALGISQAAYDEALRYAKAREQFGKSIYDIPVVMNMLMDMRVTLESDRSLLYATCHWVDLRNKLEERVETLKAAGKDSTDASARLKEASRLAALLTPMTKYVLSENANRITYDALQIHGGTGYMREFNVERLTRDARITNIYEGTSQLQVVAAIGGVINDTLADYFDACEQRENQGKLAGLADELKEMRVLFLDCLKYVTETTDKQLQSVAAKELVEMYSYLYTGWLLMGEAADDSRKVFIARRYIIGAAAKARRNAEAIKKDLFGDLLYAGDVLV